MGTPSIVANSVTVTEDIVETSASVTSTPFGSGLDLSSHAWLSIQVDSAIYPQFTVSGVNPASTQVFEVVAAINAATGLNLAAQITGGKFIITSTTEGSGSQIIFNAITGPATGNAYGVLFDVGSPSYPVTASTGIGAATYVEGVDYEVDYVDGYIYQTSFSAPSPRGSSRQTITSGQTMINGSTTGSIVNVSGSLYKLHDSVTNKFNNQPLIYVRVGDEVTITSASGAGLGALPKTFIVSEVIDGQNLYLAGFSPTGEAGSVTYTIVSTQTVNISYEYNPISIDVGGNVLLPNGTHGIRPGRTDYTISDTPFAIIQSIQQVDPNTGELLGTPLNPPGGYGSGGYGLGGYGVGNAGDYTFIVNDPTVRFSVYEDSMIVFNENALSLSYQVTFLYCPELQAVHTLTRSEIERVTGADVLIKLFVPAFVSTNINVVQNPTNASPPTDAASSTAVQNLVNTTLSPAGVSVTDIITLLEGMGIEDVQTPFTLTAKVYNPDGSTSIYTSQDVLTVPTPTLPSQTSNPTTARISAFFPGTITVTTVTP
jgi:hypothetical protein